MDLLKKATDLARLGLTGLVDYRLRNLDLSTCLPSERELRLSEARDAADQLRYASERLMAYINTASTSIDRCPVCDEPCHATEGDAEGRHPACAEVEALPDYFAVAVEMADQAQRLIFDSRTDELDKLEDAIDKLTKAAAALRAHVEVSR